MVQKMACIYGATVMKKIVKRVKTQKTRTQLKKKADILFSKWIRARDRKCLMCGKTTNLQCAHIITRANLTLRYAPDNAVTLCWGCHIQKWHRSPLEGVTWFQTKFPARYKWLMKTKNFVVKPEYEKIIEKYL